MSSKQNEPFLTFIKNRIESYERGSANDKASGDIKNQEIMEHCASVLKYQVELYERELEATEVLKRREAKKLNKETKDPNVVNLDKLRKAVKYIGQVNRIKLEDVVIELKDKSVKLPQNIIDEWGYIGLSNRDLYLQIKDDGSVTKKVTTYLTDVKPPRRYLDKLPVGGTFITDIAEIDNWVIDSEGVELLEAIEHVTTEFVYIVAKRILYLVPCEEPNEARKRTDWVKAYLVKRYGGTHVN